LASRLSEDPSVSVLLLEAGGNGLHLETRIPVAAGELQHSHCDWEDYCETQPGRACLDVINGRSFWPRGKCLGGSSVLNYMAYVIGNREDYNSWAQILSDPKWGWDSVKAIFKRMENCSTIPGLDPTVRGMSGPLNVSVKSPINPIARAWVEAAAFLGFSTGDYNDGVNQECASLMQTTTKRGARHSAADAYIWPILAQRPNLHVMLNTETTRVLFDPTSPSSTATSSSSSSFLQTKGVEYLDPRTKQLRTVLCRREVILSASAVGSPKLLLLSGVGPRDELEALGIPCLLNHPQVGKNLQDHVVVAPVVNATRSPVDIGTINQHKGKNFPNGLWAFLEWLVFGTGHLASSTYDTTLFMKSGLNESLPFPDLQLGQPSLSLSLSPSLRHLSSLSVSLFLFLAISVPSLDLARCSQVFSLDYSLRNFGLTMLVLIPLASSLMSSWAMMLRALCSSRSSSTLFPVAPSPCAPPTLSTNQSSTLDTSLMSETSPPWPQVLWSASKSLIRWATMTSTSSISEQSFRMV
jgi:choline dehydrogenase-like flavoprotein